MNGILRALQSAHPRGFPLEAPVGESPPRRGVVAILRAAAVLDMLDLGLVPLPLLLSSPRLYGFTTLEVAPEHSPLAGTGIRQVSLGPGLNTGDLDGFWVSKVPKYRHDARYLTSTELIFVDKT